MEQYPDNIQDDSIQHIQSLGGNTDCRESVIRYLKNGSFGFRFKNYSKTEKHSIKLNLIGVINIVV